MGPALLAPTPGRLIETALAPADLRRSGRAIFRRVSGPLRRATIVVEGFRRVDGDRSTLLVHLAGAGSTDYQGLFLLSVRGGRVAALRVPLPEGTIGLAPWCRSGDRIVGGVFLVPGNWTNGAVVLLRRERGAWRFVANREIPGEIGGEGFRILDGSRVRVTTRNYDFARLVQPHAGPLLVEDEIWLVEGDRIRARAAWVRRTPLADFDAFCDAVLSGDGRTARRLCAPDLYRRAGAIVRETQRDSGRLSVVCPWNYELDEGRAFSLRSDRDPKTFFVMRPWNGGWRIAALRPETSFPHPRIGLPADRP